VAVAAAARAWEHVGFRRRGGEDDEGTGRDKGEVEREIGTAKWGSSEVFFQNF
jgi:hypothetical protein